MTSLRPQLDHYVRALKERDDHPDERQDLGTFLTWLLRRSGYTIRLAPFHYKGPKRRVSKGRYQRGIDLVASRPNKANSEVEDLFLVVLKRGDIGRSQWRDEAGITGDLNELLDTKPESHNDWLPLDVDPDRVNVVVVHNGEFDDEALADMRRIRQQRFEREGFGFEWWSAPELVDKTLSVLGEGPDHELFPPTVRPFYGALLDGLETSGKVSMDAVERLLAARLPGQASELHRTMTELSVFAAMMANLPRTRSQALLAALDMMLALLSRCAAAVAAEEASGVDIRESLGDLLSIFVDLGDCLAQVLQPLAEIEDGLVYPTIGESIDWPLRTMWVLRYLVLTVRAANDLATFERAKATAADLEADRERAEAVVHKCEDSSARCLQLSLALAERNIGAVGTPITDDQLIEYVLLWRTWLDAGYVQQTKRTVEELITRLVLRRQLGSPGPALYQQARAPMRDTDARALAEAWFGGSKQSSTAFEDGGSTLIPLSLFVGLRLGVDIGASVFQAFGALDLGDRKRGVVHPQSWSPPKDATQRWYGEDLSRSGVCHIYEFSQPNGFPSSFEERQGQLGPSPMHTLGFESIDGMAWVHWRTRPPLRWLLDALPSESSIEGS